MAHGRILHCVRRASTLAGALKRWPDPTLVDVQKYLIHRRHLHPLQWYSLHHRMIAVMLPLQLRWYVVSIVVAFVVDVVFVLALIVFSHCIRLHVLRNSPVDVLQAHSVAPER